jgi:hypothetical protein
MVPTALPSNRHERWRLLRKLVEAWFPVKQLPGVAVTTLDMAEDRLGLRLPAALREWYELAGDHPDVWSRRADLRAPPDFRFIRDTLVFYRDEEAGACWGIRRNDLRMEDPPVVIDARRGEGWMAESKTTSAFAIQMLLWNVKWGGSTATFAGNGPSGSRVVALIEQAYPALPLPDWNWPLFPTRFFGKDNVLIELDGEEWIWVTAREQWAAVQVMQLLTAAGMQWSKVPI